MDVRDSGPIEGVDRFKDVFVLRCLVRAEHDFVFAGLFMQRGNLPIAQPSRPAPLKLALLTNKYYLPDDAAAFGRGSTNRDCLRDTHD